MKSYKWHMRDSASPLTNAPIRRRPQISKQFVALMAWTTPAKMLSIARSSNLRVKILLLVGDETQDYISFLLQPWKKQNKAFVIISDQNNRKKATPAWPPGRPSLYLIYGLCVALTKLPTILNMICCVRPKQNQVGDFNSLGKCIFFQ